MTREETKLTLDRIAQRHGLRVVDADDVCELQQLISKMQTAIQTVYMTNRTTCSHYCVAGRHCLSLAKPDKALEFAARGEGLLEANDNILRALDRFGLDVIECPK